MNLDKLKLRILAIETSCDETAAAVIEKSGSDIHILSNIVASQIQIHQKFGGVFPEMASRAHTEKIIPVIAEALGKIDPDVIAVTTGPGLIGSLLIGVNAAKTLSYATNKPIIGINHWLGHIYSNWASPCSSLSLPIFPSLILIVSGGHTGLVLMKSHTKIITLGETLDDAAGEAFDKVAKLLGLGYPGGPAIAATAAKVISNKLKVIRNINLPRPMLESNDYNFSKKNFGNLRTNYNFSFSGLKTAVLYKIKELSKTYTLNPIRYTLAFEFQQAVTDILIAKTIKAAYEFRPKSICLCGGVSANQELRQQLKMAVEKLPSKTSYHIPPMALTTDNAAMIGIAAAYQNPKKYTTFDKISADSNLKL